MIWLATYRDGNKVPQFQDGKEIGFDTISRHDLWFVQFIDEKGKEVLLLELYKGCQPFYRRRTKMHTDGSPSEIYHIIGYRKADRDDSLVLLINDQTGSIEVGDFRKENEKRISGQELRYGINIRDSDLVAVS